ncbi:MAG: hypothetical protein QME96_09960, partial [Myxococcota bacterium]|nr:hypothetical protein [Myxococcota bacterium]
QENIRERVTDLVFKVRVAGLGAGDEDAATHEKAKIADEPQVDAFRELAPKGRPGYVLDLDDFGEGYLAVVHADGNGIGRWVQGKGRFGSLDDQGRFSEALRMATADAARDAIAGLAAATRDEKGVAKQNACRPVVLGGDDLTVILRARDAIAFAECYLEAFERHTRKRMGEAKFGNAGFTACAGIAIVKSGWPFSQACRLAEELCTAAKRALDGGDQGTPSGLLFHRVTTALAPSWGDILESELAAGRDGTDRLSGGPYVVGTPPDGKMSLDGLRRLADRAAALPRTALREWLRIVKSDPARAEAHYKRAMEVLESRPLAAR